MTNNTRPRILFLYGDIPYPANTGARIRTYNLLINAAKDADITLLTLLDPTQAEADKTRIAHMQSFGITVDAVLRPAESKSGLFAALFKSLLSTRPLIVDRYTFRPYLDRVRELVSTHQFDLLHCDSISLAQGVRTLSNREIPFGLTAHNVEAIIWERWAKEEPNLLKRLYVNLQYHKVFHYEQTLSQEADLVCAVSEEDQERLRTMYAARHAAVVPNGVDVDYFAPQNIPEEDDTLVFTGSMDWRPNQDGILWFVDEIWPLLLHARPKLKFWIVGRRPPERLVKLGQSDSRLIVTGTVDDVRGYIARGAVYVVPLRIGGGSRLKILEAMSMRKGMVSTTVGAEGLRVEAEKQLLLADTPHDFSQRVIELLESPSRRRTLGEAGEKLVHAHYTWPQIAKGQVELWQEAISRFRSNTTSRANS